MATLKGITRLGLLDFINSSFSDIDSISSVEAAAKILAKGMYDAFGDGTESEFILSRVFHSFEYGALPGDIQEAAKQNAGDTLKDNSLFLALIGTYGCEPAWQNRRTSCGHKAIPLTLESVKKIPMVSRLFQQIGFDLGIMLGVSSPGIVSSGVEQSYGVFFVDDARNSPYIPAQDFVKRYGVRSVFGSGVKLPDNSISAYIGFTRIALDYENILCLSSLMPLFWHKAFAITEKGFFDKPEFCNSKIRP